jgi:hypothetical protein
MVEEVISILADIDT